MSTIRTIKPDEIEAVIDLIVELQADPATGTCYIGAERDGLLLELQAFPDTWPARTQVVVDGETLIGASVADIDTELGKSWIHGPWVRGDQDQWDAWARPLLDAVIAGFPAEIVEHEMSSDVANVRMEALAAELGWKRSVPNHVFTADAAAAATWPADDPRVRELTADDAAAVQPLHDAEFPNTYLPTKQLVERSLAGKQISVVSEAASQFLGYASGNVQADGTGYLDFLAITPDARGTGAGIGLLATIGRKIVTAAPEHNLNLTVQDHRAQAVGLYRKFGFNLDSTIVGYSSPKPDAQAPRQD